MSETYFWVAALLDQVLNLDLRPNFKIARVSRVPFAMTTTLERRCSTFWPWPSRTWDALLTDKALLR